MKNNVSGIIKNSIILGLYVILTIFLPSLTFGPLQIRISEVLMFIILFDSNYIYGLVLGVGIANIFSPLGFFDVIFGSISSLLFLLTIILINKITSKKNPILFVVFGTLYNAITVSLEYCFIMHYPFIISFIEILFSEGIILFIGYFVYKYIIKNDKLVELIRIKNEKED